MEAVFDEEMIREELRRIDKLTGLHGADLPIRFGNARSHLGQFSYKSDDDLFFYFSNYYYQDPNHPVEEKIDTIRHEYAHYMDYMLHGSTSHGPLWKKCCEEIGAFPTTHFNRKRSDSFLAKHEKERQQNEKYDGYAVGDTIRHPRFGSGTILDILGDGTDRIACVSFGDAPVKKLTVSWIDANCQKQPR